MTNKTIDVWFVALGSDTDEVTIKIGNDLKNLLESKQLIKLGDLLKDKIIKIAFGGKNAPQSPTTSNNNKLWLTIGITLAILLVLALILLCYGRRMGAKTDEEEGPNHYPLGYINGSKSRLKFIVNEGFDDQVGVVLNEPNDSNQQEPSDQRQEENRTPLVEGEDTDDELDFHIAIHFPSKLNGSVAENTV